MTMNNAKIASTTPPNSLWLHWRRLMLCGALLLSATLSAYGQSGDPGAAEQDRVDVNTGLSEAELELWNSEHFKKQFTLSYIAETEIEPSVTMDERDTLQEILKLIGEDKLERAKERLQDDRGENASAVYDFTVGNIFFQQGELDDAAAAYRIAVEKYPKFRRAWKNLAIIYVRQEKFESAALALTRVVELGGGDSVTYGLLGFSYSRLEKHISAESAYRMAVLLDPETLDWKLGMARSFFMQERFAEAAAMCQQMIVEYPSQIDLWLLQANAFISMEQPLRAAENYELLHRMGESTFDTLSTLGDIYINAELFGLAVDAYMRALAVDDLGEPDRVVRGIKALAGRKAMGQAEQLIDRVDEVFADKLTDETRKEILKIQARLAVARGGSAEEAKILEQIIQLDPRDGEALILLGQYYMRQFDRTYERAQAAKANDKAQDTEKLTDEAETYFAKAAMRFEQAANIDSVEADARVRHAQLLVKKKQYKDALRLLRQAQRINPRDNVQEYLEQVERIAKSQSN